MAAFKLNEVKLDLFHVPQTYSLAYSSTADFYAERGTLAWQFSVIFGQTDELRRQHSHSGNVAVLEDNGRFIYHLITKETMFERVTYENVEAALICMKHHMRNHSAFKVAMPRICCNNKDGLIWSQVKEIILRVFAGEYNVEIMICNYKPPKIKIPKCRIVEQRGHDKTPTKNSSVVHAISADFAMCSGIGLQFKCKYGQTHELLKQDHHRGNVAVLKDHNRYVYNLVIKERNHEKSTYIALFYALICTRDHMRQHNVKNLAMPRLGCGIDRLEWLRVRDILEIVFGNDDIEITTNTHEALISVPSRDQLHIHCMSCKRAF